MKLLLSGPYCPIPWRIPNPVGRKLWSARSSYSWGKQGDEKIVMRRVMKDHQSVTPCSDTHPAPLHHKFFPEKNAFDFCFGDLNFSSKGSVFLKPCKRALQPCRYFHILYSAAQFNCRWHAAACGQINWGCLDISRNSRSTCYRPRDCVHLFFCKL